MKAVYVDTPELDAFIEAQLKTGLLLVAVPSGITFEVIADSQRGAPSLPGTVWQGGRAWKEERC